MAAQSISAANEAPSDHQSETMMEKIGDLDIELGKKLKALRVQSGKTQADIAQHLAISAQQYQKYEKGATKCSLTTIYKLAAYYDRPVSDLLPGVITDEAGFREDAPVFSTDRNGNLTNEAAAISELLAIFIRIPSKTTRRKLLDLLNEIF